jgi:hypothetical protein
MPIFTPCADTGAANKMHAATAAKNPDFIFIVSPQFLSGKLGA